MSTIMHWALTSDELVFHSGGVKDSHTLNTTETRDKHWFRGPPGT